MPEALMVGYVRGERTIAKTLIPSMRREKQQKSLKTTRLPVAVEDGDGQREPLHDSRHRRGFRWRENKGRASRIRIYHSWHQC